MSCPGNDGAGKGFDLIGTENETAPLVLKDLQSYDEMGLSSLLAVSTPTFFINSGSRGNRAIVNEEADEFENTGVLVGQVGARFERIGRMEWKHLIVTKEQNTTANGYGPQGNNALLKVSHSPV